jgi:integrase
MKYLRRRGNIFHFERPIPKDVQPTLKSTLWRESLRTDSKTEAEKLCRIETVKTDEIIAQVRAGKFRRLSDHEIDYIAVWWITDLQQINEQYLPNAAYPHLLGEHLGLGDEAPSPILRSKSEVETELKRWELRFLDDVNVDIKIEIDSPDWDALLTECIDNYIFAFTDDTNAKLEIFAEFGVDFSNEPAMNPPKLKRVKRKNPAHSMSSMLKSYMNGNIDLGDSVRSDFATAVRRFIDLNGDMSIVETSRVHAEKFRDALRDFPSKLPDEIRKLSMSAQVQWAQATDAKMLAQASTNKNILGVRLMLNYAFEETSAIEDRDWRNPFDGFAKKTKPSSTPIGSFTDDQWATVFSHQIYTTNTAEKFWIPLVLFYTGARLDEISQLHIGDIYASPVPYILAENLDDAPSLAKKLKSISSNRTIPIHKDLIHVGFLEYVEKIRNRGHTHLFPNLPHQQTAKRGNLVSRDFIRRFRKHGELNPSTGLNTKPLVTYSLRHSFRMSEFELLEQVFVQVVMGHHVNDVSYATSGRQIYHRPKTLAEKVIAQIPLVTLDLDFLSSEAKRHLEHL